jgi:hypothetical protein
MGLVASHVSPVARSMRRVRTPRRYTVAQWVATIALLAAAIVCLLAGAGALAHLAWRVILWGWSS